MSKTILKCSQTTATLIFILLGSLFLFTGCLQLYRTLGLTDEQAAAQVAQDQADRQKIIEDIRFTTTELILAATSGLGAIASGFLTKWLGTERKITKTLITAVESVNANTTKEAIRKKATTAGIEPQLNARVRTLT